MSTAAFRPVSINDIATKAGVSYATACNCLHNKRTNSYSKSTQEKVLSIARNLGYDRNASLGACGRHATSVRVAKHAEIPANPVFASRTAETAAMMKLRSSGHSDVEIAHRCGVSKNTVYRRIGTQPEAITAANLKLAGKVRSAKAKIKKNYQSQQLVSTYNAKVEALNAEMAKVKQMASEIESMRKSAAKASKATGTPLLCLLPVTKAS